MDIGKQRLWLGVVLSPSLFVLGAVVGGVLSRFTRQGGMGWDHLAQALGGMMIGGLAGAIVAIVLARRLGIAALRALTIATTLLAGGLVALSVARYQREMAMAAAEAGAPRPMAPTTVPVVP